MNRKIVKLYYSLPIPYNWKINILRLRRKIIGYREIEEKSVDLVEDENIQSSYIKQILEFPNIINHSGSYVKDDNRAFERVKSDVKIFAFYLTQFHPTKENDEWWGKGTTEWTNVTRAMPQYLGHDQPRLPDELGYYDLRVKDNMRRQIELAKQYGIFGFCFYHYWFNGRRILEAPLNMFLEDKTLDFPFCYCWANHSWYKKFQGTSDEVLIEIPDDVEVYKRYIDSILPDMSDNRYYKIQGKPLLIVYAPANVPNPKIVLKHWRERAQAYGFEDLYIMAVHGAALNTDYRKYGYDASCDFHPTTLFNRLSEVPGEVQIINNSFSGTIYDYTKIVDNRLYMKYQAPKLYRSVMTFWDNTARKDSRAMIFAHATPEKYKKWIKDVIEYTKDNKQLDDNIAFINAWNEWGEGAYLEPDKKYGFSLLHSTRDALEESRGN